jgi:hypothetical protein
MRVPAPDRRRSVRQKCFVEARAFFDSQPALPCSIMDVTPLGAKLTTKAPVPARAEKILVFIPAIGKIWAARICWQRGQSLGVEFICGEADLTQTENPADAGTFALRLQVAQIAKTVKRLSA